MIVTPQKQQIIGRDDVLDTLLIGLRLKSKSAQLVIGEEGSGKTALAAGLAQKLHDAATGPLAGFTVTMLPAEQLLQAETESELLLQTVEVAGQRSVVFMDDLDVAAVIGGEIGVKRDLLLTLRRLIERSDRHIILTISAPYVGTLQRVYPEFFDELQIIDLPPLSATELHRVASRQATRIAWFHGVAIDERSIETACAPANSKDRMAHPALALQRLDQAAAAAAHNRSTHAIVSVSPSHKPFDKATVANGLTQRIKGQDHVIKAVVERLSIARAGLDLRPRRPDGVFMLAGPTGVGKTEFALALAQQLYGSDEEIIRLDMSEYRSEHEVARLVGPPPGYRGSERPEEWLTTKVIDNPHRVLLLDEFEKADPVVWQTFLQVFDAGRLTDGRGRVADFRDTVILLTSNIGAETFIDRPVIGFGEGNSSSVAGDEKTVMRAIESRLAPELINRLDRVLIFRPLEPEAMRQIVQYQTKIAQSRVAALGVTLEFEAVAENYLAEHGYSRAYGARPLQRVLEEQLIMPVSQLTPGTYAVGVDESGLTFEVAWGPSATDQ